MDCFFDDFRTNEASVSDSWVQNYDWAQ